MKQPDVRYAMLSREWGLRRVRRLTWGIAGAGAVGAIAIVVGFSGHVHVPKISQPAQGQAPAGNQGAAGQQTGNQAPGGGQLQPPAANPVPAQGPGQVVSGGS
jgi:hypothetical protein